MPRKKELPPSSNSMGMTTDFTLSLNGMKLKVTPTPPWMQK
jgi:hypothetical protein